MIEYLAIVLPVASMGVSLITLLLASELKDEVERLSGDLYEYRMEQLNIRRRHRG